MLSPDLIPGRSWLVCRQLDQPYEYEPRGNCHEPISASLAAIGLSTAAEAGTAAVAGAAAETAATGGLFAAGEAAGTGILGTGIGLGDIGAAASLGGTLLSAKAGMDNADYQSAVARSEAAALKQKSDEDAAAAERTAITQDRKTQLVQSRLRALAAGGGTDATSPDVVNTEGQIAEQGQYNSLSALYEGQARARSDNYQADIDLFKARTTSAAAPLAAAGTVLSGLSSFADRRSRLRYYQLGGYAGAGA